MEKKIYPLIEKCYIVGTHQYCYRAGEPAEIVGVKIGRPSKDAEPRLAYKIEFPDGVVDYVAVSDVGVNYKLISFDDIVIGTYHKFNSVLDKKDQ